MKKNTNHQELFEMRNDIIAQCNKSIAFKTFHEHKINEFFSHNKMRLELMDKKIDELVRLHVKHDDVDLKPVTAIGESGKVEYQFESEENKDAYMKSFNEIMSAGLTMHL